MDVAVAVISLYPSATILSLDTSRSDTLGILVKDIPPLVLIVPSDTSVTKLAEHPTYLDPSELCVIVLLADPSH